jgi:hypothetical protein
MDTVAFNSPRPAGYIIAIEFQVDGFYVVRPGYRSPRIAAGNVNSRRLSIRSDGRNRYTVLRGGSEVWSS